MAEERTLLRFIIFLTLLSIISADCIFHDRELLHGELLYEQESDVNMTLAPNNYILQFQCDKGYQLTESQLIFCREYEWSNEWPHCVRLDCPQPPTLKHGTFEILKGTIKNLIVGSIAMYSCIPGYEMADTNQTALTCVIESDFATWKGAMPNCTVKESCPDPGVSPHGSKKGSCCSVGDVVTYSCKKGYHLKGDDSIICLLGGNWSTSRPKCLPSEYCPDPPNIKNGFIVRTENSDFYDMYEEIEIRCNQGFAFYGENKYVFCEDNFNWDVEFGECRESFCPAPQILANGTIEELESNNATEFADGFFLTYVCDNDFRLIGDNVRHCNKGSWSGKEPHCEEVHCYDPGMPENGQRNGDDFSIGSKVVFSCFSGFHLIGSVERYCLPNGQWSGVTPRCNLKSNYCPDPGAPLNGKKNGSNYAEGATVEFFCFPGFTLIGTRVRQCLHNGTWSGDEPQCLGVHDYDNKNEVGEILKLAIAEKADEQAAELEKYQATVNKMKRTKATQRILNLNYPGRLVLYFIFDVSGSIQKKHFQTSIKFAKALTKKVGVSKDGARVGALTFSSQAKIEFLPLQYTTTEEVLEALNIIEFKKGGTATSSALQMVFEEMIPLSREYFGSKNVKSVVFILTDGRANTGGNPKIQANRLKEAGVEIYCIGITGDIKKNGLYELASLPIHEHVFILNNYKTLEWLVQEVTNGTIDYSQCGLGLEKVGAGNPRARIYGGQVAIEPWPWMAALYYKDEESDYLPSQLKCGGSIVDKQWVLTAGHCLTKKDASRRLTTDLIIKLGLTDVDNSTKLQEFEALEFVIHPEYNNDNLDYDIALIKLDRLIEYNPYVLPICLPPEDILPDSDLYDVKQNAFATGWGYDEKLEIGQPEFSKSVKILKELLLPLQKRETCLQSLLDLRLTEDRFTERMFCAGKGDGSADTCVGDSGGPLMQSQFNNAGHVYWTQIGIVSWGLGCGQPNTFGIYTKLNSVVAWIHTEIKR